MELMSKVSAIPIPPSSLLAGFGGEHDYRDCFVREVPGEVPLSDLIERFYCSRAFRPERVVLGLIGKGATNEDARALARGEADGIALWSVVERRENEILLTAGITNTASWLAVEQGEGTTRLLFGSWVRKLDQSGWRFMRAAHDWYSRALLSAV